MYGFSVQYAPGKSFVELARAGQFPNAQISYAYDDEFSAALAPLNLTMRLVIGIVKLGEDGTANGERIQPVTPGQRVILYMDELEVEATILYEDGYWMAQPDEATWRDIVPEE